MKTGSFSRMSKTCQICPLRDDCKDKRLEACAYIIPGPIAASAPVEITAPLVADVLVKHDYRNIKIAEGMTITIDLEEAKERMKRDIYKSLHCRFLDYGG